MKKIVVAFLAVALLLALAAPAMAAASCYFSGPKEVRAGETITLTFYADGNVTGINGSISYDAAKLTLKEYKPLIGGTWAVEFAGNNFICYDNSMENPLGGGKAIFSATFQVSAELTPGTEVVVTASGVTMSNSQGDEYSGSVQWSTNLSQPKSDNANLAALTLSNATISPAFDPNVTEYKTSVPFEVSTLKLSAAAAHAGAKVSIGNTALAENATSDVTITVTAENGATKVYHIYTWRPADPNYEPSEVSTLQSLEAEGFLLSPVFVPEQMDYAVYLPNEVQTLKLTAKPTDAKAKVEIPTIENIPLGKNTYEVVVTAENGNIRIYTVTTFRAEPFQGPYVTPEETEPATEPTTEPTAEPTETEAPTTQPAPSNSGTQSSGKNTGLLWILSVVAAFLGGFVVPTLMWNRE